MELLLLLLVLPRHPATLSEPTAWTCPINHPELESKCCLAAGSQEIKSRKRWMMFQMKSPHDYNRTSNTYLTVYLLFLTNDLGGILREISKFEENTLSSWVVKHQDGGKVRSRQRQGSSCRVRHRRSPLQHDMAMFIG